ncbi:CD63 antigen-like [Paramacrobiotus metropolitanus]|uniref:CD63 antigen-like n=1 Tax=Paramacrobiotus metropolitanus TaxID=2943436 RepID=UPI002446499A|nr:CD63 antigen-like [Paramacrobiotus metropolitanus]
MGETSQNCVKWLMFIFNFIFWIIGLGLIIAGAIAQTKYKEYFHLMDSENVSITAPVLLIIVGVIIFLISFLGCCGAARESYWMLITFSCLMGLIFVMQIAGGIAGFVQKGKVEDWIKKGMKHDIEVYLNKTNPDSNLLVDTLQEELHCCGSEVFTDWGAYKDPTTKNQGLPPKSCCRVPKESCNITAETTYLNTTCTNPAPESQCVVYTQGCAPQVISILGTGLAGVAGVALGLAVIELIGIVMACYLGKRVRSGYTYA